MYKPSPCGALLLYFPSPLPCLLGALLTQHGVNTGARGADSPSTYRCQYIGLHCVNFQYGHRKWNNGPLVESRCQIESGTSFLSRTHFPASLQMCVEASDRWQTGREKFDALLSSLAALTFRRFKLSRLRVGAGESHDVILLAQQPGSLSQSHKSLIKGANRSDQQIRPADGPRSAQSKGEANSNQ